MDQVSFVGYLVIGLATVIGLFLAVGKPIMSAVKIMTELNISVKKVQENLNETRESIKDAVEHARRGREKLWKAHGELEDRVDKHEIRIGNLETTVKILYPDSKE